MLPFALVFAHSQSQHLVGRKLRPVLCSLLVVAGRLLVITTINTLRISITPISLCYSKHTYMQIFICLIKPKFLCFSIITALEHVRETESKERESSFIVCILSKGISCRKSYILLSWVLICTAFMQQCCLFLTGMTFVCLKL